MHSVFFVNNTLQPENGKTHFRTCRDNENTIIGPVLDATALSRLSRVEFRFELHRIPLDTIGTIALASQESSRFTNQPGAEEVAV